MRLNKTHLIGKLITQMVIYTYLYSAKVIYRDVEKHEKKIIEEAKSLEKARWKQDGKNRKQSG